MRNLVNKALVLAGKYKISASTVHQSLFNLIGYYFWSKSSKYFPATAYNEDTRWAYIDIWYPNPDSTYNGVPPLTQIHGDHYETEREWVEKRIAYIFSKYQIGAFEAQSADGYGSLEFTAANDFTMNVTPAIALYPRTSKGGAVTEPSDRTMAGEVYPMVMTGSGDTARYLKGVDWLSDIGDCSGLTLASRGGATEIAFTVKGKRLRRLKVGDENPDNVRFNATRIAISGEAIEDIDARNASSIQGSLNLSECPRLRTADFTGTNLAVILPPVGGRMRYLALPKSLSTLFLHNLNLLEAENLVLEDGKNINLLYFNTCSNLEPLTLLRKLVETPENKLQGISMIFTEPITDTDPKNMEMLADLVRNIGPDGYFLVSYNDGTLIPDTNKAPGISGKIITDYPIYEDSVQLIEEKLVNLDVVYNPEKVCIRFEDQAVSDIVATNWGWVDEETGEPLGTTQAQMANVTSIGTVFKGNTEIEYFDEFEKFVNVTDIAQNAFTGCTNLKSINLKNAKIIRQNAFSGDANLSIELDAPNITTVLQGAFNNSGITSINLPNIITYEGAFSSCKNLKEIKSLGNIKTITGFSSCSSLSKINLPDNIDTIGNSAFLDCSIEGSLTLDVKTIGARAFWNNKINHLILKNTITIGNVNPYSSDQGPFGNNTELQSVTFPETLVTIGGGAFYKDTSLIIEDLSLPNLENLSEWAFANTKIKKVSDLGKVTILNSNVFNGCKDLTEVVIPKTVTTANGAFLGCTALKTVKGGGESISTMNSTFSGCVSLETIEETDFFNNVLTIGKNTFYNTPKLNIDVYVPNLLELGLYALRNTGITSFIAPKLRTLGQEVFRESINLKTLNIGQITTLSSDSCYNCNSLETLILPKNFINFGSNCLSNTKLTNFIFPISTQTISNGAFNGVNFGSTTNIELPNLKTLGSSFRNTTNVYKVLNLGKVVNVADRIFHIGGNPSNINYIRLPYSIQSSDYGMFEFMTTLQILICDAITPPSISQIWNKNPYYIYVPDESLEDYKTSSSWSNYANIIFPISDYITFTDITSNLISDIQYTTNLEVYDVFDYTEVAESGAKSMIYELDGTYDTLKISGNGGTDSRLYCFIDENDEVITTADESLIADPLYIAIPTMAKKMIICCDSTSTNVRVEIGKHIEEEE